jgi:hypothetical protein
MMMVAREPRGLMHPRTAVLLLPVLAAALVSPTWPNRVGLHTRTETIAPVVGDTTFARLIERLSEPGGYFSSDNLVSNEASYLHVLGRMREMGIKGGAYVGVGPDQNFSYIAQIRPDVAFLIDIRRDNLLHHLLFKALFQNARNRVEYLCLLTGRAQPSNTGGWSDATVQEIVEYIDVMPPDSIAFEESSRRVRESVLQFAVPLSEADLATIRRFHTEFYRWGLDIRYSNRFGVPLWNMPAFRQLLLETDLDGKQLNYLAREESFRFLKDMQRKNRIVPVVGDLAGDHALAAIGHEISERRLTISAFYVSNVEQYLMRDGVFDRFATTTAELPFDEKSVIIRSYFGRGWPHRDNIPGYYATQLLERIEDFANQQKNGGYTSYLELVQKNILPLRDPA